MSREPSTVLQKFTLLTKMASIYINMPLCLGSVLASHFSCSAPQWLQWAEFWEFVQKLFFFKKHQWQSFQRWASLWWAPTRTSCPRRKVPGHMGRQHLKISTTLWEIYYLLPISFLSFEDGFLLLRSSQWMHFKQLVLSLLSNFYWPSRSQPKSGLWDIIRYKCVYNNISDLKSHKKCTTSMHPE